MAKRKKTESVLSRETNRQADEAARTAVAAEAKAAEAAAAEAAAAAAAARKRAAEPVAKAVRPKKPKKARFVREAKEKQPRAKAATPTPRSTKAAGKLMTKNLHEAPKDAPDPDPRSNDFKGRM
jgi:hypothetical protein